MYRFAPLTSRLRARFGRHIGLAAGLSAAASRSWTVSPTVEKLMPPSIFDPSDLQKIIGVPVEDTIESQITKAKGGWQQHRATTAFELEGAVLTDGHLFTSKLAHELNVTPMPFLARRANRHLDEAVLATSWYGTKYFGHWMTDDLPLMLAAQELGRPISTLARPTPHQVNYMQALDIEAEVCTSAYFKKIVILEDFGQNDYKRLRYAQLRDRARAGRSPQGNVGVMLLRGTTGARRVLRNEVAVAEMVMRRGFKIVDPSKSSVAEIIEACLDASTVLGVEGSQLAHGLMWMSTVGTLVVLQPPQRFNATHKDRCDCEGIRFAFVVGDRREGGDFWIDVSALERMLDRL